MISKKCPKCEKVIEGYNSKQVEWLMMQHNLIHRREEIEKEEAKENDKTK